MSCPNSFVFTLVVGSVASLAPASAQSLEIISRAPGNTPQNVGSYGRPCVSANGRFVAFNSSATNLAPGQVGGGGVFVMDRVTQIVELVSVSVGGNGPSGMSQVGGISDSGRYVTFLGNGLTPGDAMEPGAVDVYLRDRQAGTTVELTGVEFQALEHSRPQISGDGQLVVWRDINSWFGSVQTQILVKTSAGVLVGVRSGDSASSSGARVVDDPILATGGRYVVYVYRGTTNWQILRWDLQTPGSTDLVVATLPVGAAMALDTGAISRDGRFVVFQRMTPTFGFETWLRDIDAAVEERVDVGTGGGPGFSFPGDVSDDGRFVVFTSSADSLVSGDTNGVADVFVRDRVTHQTARANIGITGTQSSALATDCVFDRSDLAVLFLTSAALSPNDGNPYVDVYRHSACTLTFADGDGDGYGTGSALFTCEQPPPSYVALDGDCDDANVARHPNAPELCNGVDDDCDSVIDEDIAGATFCSGDGTSAACPCGSAGASGRGCPNSVNPSGARIGTLGCASLSADNVVLTGSGMPDGPVLYFQGAGQAGGGAGVVFGDGVRCVAGPFVRLSVKTNVAGASSYPSVGDSPISVLGGVIAPGARFYQAHYRDAAAFCTSATFNLTNGLSVLWVP